VYIRTADRPGRGLRAYPSRSPAAVLLRQAKDQLSGALTEWLTNPPEDRWSESGYQWASPAKRKEPNYFLYCEVPLATLTNFMGRTMSVATSKLITRPWPSRLKCRRNWPSLRSPIKPS